MSTKVEVVFARYLEVKKYPTTSWSSIVLVINYKSSTSSPNHLLNAALSTLTTQHWVFLFQTKDSISFIAETIIGYNDYVSHAAHVARRHKG